MTDDSRQGYMPIMVWALAIVAILGVGLPVAAWRFSRRPRSADSLRGYDEIDRWLADHFQLSWRERSRARNAVFGGREARDPALRAAARALAAEVLAGRFRSLRLARKIGWAHLAIGLIYAAFGIVLLIVRHHSDALALCVIAVLNGGLFAFTGTFHAIQNPKRIRRNAERVEGLPGR